MKGHWKKKLFGDKQFYKMVLLIAVPIMIQNGITNFVSLLDNIMVGQVGTEQMTGVAIVNQLIFVYNLCIFGGVSGAGIFTAQFFGQKDDEGVANTFRFKLWMAAILTGVTILILAVFGEPLIQMYLNGNQDGGDTAAALRYGKEYLWIMLAGLPAFMVVQVYASTLRECGSTITPMKAGITAVLVNLVFNYLLIYGKFGFPELGVKGAAVATVMSRYVEAFIVVCWTHAHKEQNTYIKGLYRTMKIPGYLVKRILIKGTPLLLNETMWAAGMALLLQCYSVRGMNVVAGMNISNTISNLFNVVFIALGDSVAIVVGQLLGAGKTGRSKRYRPQDDCIFCYVLYWCGIGNAGYCAAVSTVIQHKSRIQRTGEVFHYGDCGVYANAGFSPRSVFTLRSGGKTIVTFFFDSVFICCISVPIAYLLGHFTELYVVYIFIAVQMADIIKCIIGFVLVKKGVWLQNIVE